LLRAQLLTGGGWPGDSRSAILRWAGCVFGFVVTSKLVRQMRNPKRNIEPVFCTCQKLDTPELKPLKHFERSSMAVASRCLGCFFQRRPCPNPWRHRRCFASQWRKFLSDDAAVNMIICFWLCCYLGDSLHEAPSFLEQKPNQFNQFRLFARCPLGFASSHTNLAALQKWSGVLRVLIQVLLLLWPGSGVFRCCSRLKSVDSLFDGSQCIHNAPWKRRSIQSKFSATCGKSPESSFVGYIPRCRVHIRRRGCAWRTSPVSSRNYFMRTQTQGNRNLRNKFPLLALTTSNNN
jgi:hypothetical protein